MVVSPGSTLATSVLFPVVPLLLEPGHAETGASKTARGPARHCCTGCWQVLLVWALFRGGLCSPIFQSIVYLLVHSFQHIYIFFSLYLSYARNTGLNEPQPLPSGCLHLSRGLKEEVFREGRRTACAEAWRPDSVVVPHLETRLAKASLCRHPDTCGLCPNGDGSFFFLFILPKSLTFRGQFIAKSLVGGGPPPTTVCVM